MVIGSRTFKRHASDGLRYAFTTACLVVRRRRSRILRRWSNGLGLLATLYTELGRLEDRARYAGFSACELSKCQIANNKTAAGASSVFWSSSLPDSSANRVVFASTPILAFPWISPKTYEGFAQQHLSGEDFCDSCFRTDWFVGNARADTAFSAPRRWKDSRVAPPYQ